MYVRYSKINFSSWKEGRNGADPLQGDLELRGTQPVGGDDHSGQTQQPERAERVASVGFRRGALQGGEADERAD